MDPTQDLSRRERQIMQVIFANGTATAKQIVDAIPDSPSRTAIRTILTILVEKGLLKFKRRGREYVYSPTRSKTKASRGALQNLLKTFYEGSLENLVASHFADPKSKLTNKELDRLEQMIKKAKTENRDE